MYVTGSCARSARLLGTSTGVHALCLHKPCVGPVPVRLV
jgi:hypothetical protein